MKLWNNRGENMEQHKHCLHERDPLVIPTHPTSTSQSKKKNKETHPQKLNKQHLCKTAPIFKRIKTQHHLQSLNHRKLQPPPHPSISSSTALRLASLGNQTWNAPFHCKKACDISLCSVPCTTTTLASTCNCHCFVMFKLPVWCTSSFRKHAITLFRVSNLEGLTSKLMMTGSYKRGSPIVSTSILSWLLMSTPDCSIWKARPWICPIHACIYCLSPFLAVRNYCWRDKLVAKPAAWWTCSKVSQISSGSGDHICSSCTSSTHKIISTHASSIFAASCLFFASSNSAIIIDMALTPPSASTPQNWNFNHGSQALPDEDGFHPNGQLSIVGVIKIWKMNSVVVHGDKWGLSQQGKGEWILQKIFFEMFRFSAVISGCNCADM